MIDENSLYRIEHELLAEAMREWVGINRETAMEDLNYIQGVVDYVSKVMDAYYEEDGEK